MKHYIEYLHISGPEPRKLTVTNIFQLPSLLETLLEKPDISHETIKITSEEKPV